VPAEYLPQIRQAYNDSIDQVRPLNASDHKRGEEYEIADLSRHSMLRSQLPRSAWLVVPQCLGCPSSIRKASRSRLRRRTVGMRRNASRQRPRA
jgi:hypothetical protein